MTSAAPPNVIATRRVMYIPGYDPVPQRAYRERYRREAAKQAACAGYDITIAPRISKGRFGWRIMAEMEGGATQTDFEVMVWADIVRASMDQGFWQAMANWRAPLGPISARARCFG